jgi:hypothetical protein
MEPRMRKLLPALLLASSPALATADHPPLHHRVVHRVSLAELQSRCPQTYSCSIPDWMSGTCTVLIPDRVLPGWPSGGAMLRHEFAHCDGKGAD